MAEVVANYTAEWLIPPLVAPNFAENLCDKTGQVVEKQGLLSLPMHDLLHALNRKTLLIGDDLQRDTLLARETYLPIAIGCSDSLAKMIRGKAFASKGGLEISRKRVAPPWGQNINIQVIKL